MENLFNYEEWSDYNLQGKLIHSKNSDGFESWSEYDEKGNCVYHKNSNGTEWWSEYDEKGNEIYSKTLDGLEKFIRIYKYDDSEIICKVKSKDGDYLYTSHEIDINKYDENGKCIHSVTMYSDISYNYTHMVFMNRDVYGRVTSTLDADGLQTFWDYNERGNCIYHKKSDGFEEWFNYDENNNCIKITNSNNGKAKLEYDKNGNLTHIIDFEGEECFCEYSEDNHPIYYKDSNGNMIKVKDAIKCDQNIIYEKIVTNNSGYTSIYSGYYNMCRMYDYVTMGMSNPNRKEKQDINPITDKNEEKNNDLYDIFCSFNTRYTPSHRPYTISIIKNTKYCIELEVDIRGVTRPNITRPKIIFDLMRNEVTYIYYDILDEEEKWERPYTIATFYKDGRCQYFPQTESKTMDKYCAKRIYNYIFL